jgi:myosin heavy subunit
MEKKPSGLLVLLDEEIVMPKGTDQTYLKKINQTHEKHERFRVNRTSPTTFTIIHYAGDVRSYSSSLKSCLFFLKKN